jgi:hypothetical protein
MTSIARPPTKCGSRADARLLPQRRAVTRSRVPSPGALLYRRRVPIPRSFSFVPLALVLLVSGCHWEQVAYRPQPAAVANPAGEIKALLSQKPYAAAVIEVNDESIKEFYPSPGHAGLVLLPLVGTTFRIITRDNMYMVAAHDQDDSEIWTYLPPGKDLATCQRMINALFALTKRQP